MQLNSTHLAAFESQLASLERTVSTLRRQLLRPELPSLKTASARANHPGYRIFGQEFSSRNANETFISLFRHFAELDTQFPDRFLKVACRMGRSRQYIGRSPQEVYPRNPDLWTQTVEFAPGWYLGTNENNATKRKLLRAASDVMKLRFDEDVQVWL